MPPDLICPPDAQNSLPNGSRAHPCTRVSSRNIPPHSKLSIGPAPESGFQYDAKSAEAILGEIPTEGLITLGGAGLRQRLIRRLAGKMRAALASPLPQGGPHDPKHRPLEATRMEARP
eukprot:6782786-Pyramimonas_sp.AAC.1